MDNKGFTSTKELTALSKPVQMVGKLHLKLFCQDKYLLNHVDLKIKLRRSRDAFALVADAVNYKIKIKEMALYVRKVQLSPAVKMGHVKALEKTSCKYPVRRVEVKVDTVPTGNINYVQDNVFGTAAKETRHCLCRQRCIERHYWGKSVRFQTLQDQFCGTQR